MTVDVVLRRIFHIFSVNSLQTWLVVHVMLLRRRHEILHFDITKLISVSTEFQICSNFYNDAALFLQAIFHTSADINA